MRMRVGPYLTEEAAVGGLCGEAGPEEWREVGLERLDGYMCRGISKLLVAPLLSLLCPSEQDCGTAEVLGSF